MLVSDKNARLRVSNPEADILLKDCFTKSAINCPNSRICLCVLKFFLLTSRGGAALLLKFDL